MAHNVVSYSPYHLSTEIPYLLKKTVTYCSTYHMSVANEMVSKFTASGADENIIKYNTTLLLSAFRSRGPFGRE